jgi:aspartate dehydrogenase
MRVGLVGYGAIGREVARLLPGADATIVAALVRTSATTAEALLVTSTDELIAAAPDVVVECAGHDGVRQHAVALLEAGIELMVISTGVFADDSLLERCVSAATRGNTHVTIPAGAIAGLDGLAALRVGGLQDVLYTSTKPASSWLGTAADDVIDLAQIDQATTFFDGDARTAALLYPKNANLAMTVALAGLGPDATRVCLVADPHASMLSGRVQARGVFASLDVTVMGPAAAANPRTSATTAHSIVAALRNRGARIVV